MNRLLPVSLCILSVTSACSAPSPDDPDANLDAASTTPVARLVRDGRTSAIRGTVPTGESDPRRAADVFLADHAAAIGVASPDDLEYRETQSHPTTSTDPSASEETVVVYDAQQDGHRVYGSEVRVIVRNGEVVYAGGSTTEDISALGEPSIDAEGAYQVLTESSEAEWELEQSELVAFNLGVFISRPTRSVLAWLLEVRDDEGSWRLFIDAQSSEELIRIPRFSNARRSSTYVRAQPKPSCLRFF